MKLDKIYKQRENLIIFEALKDDKNIDKIRLINKLFGIKIKCLKNVLRS